MSKKSMISNFKILKFSIFKKSKFHNFIFLKFLISKVSKSEKNFFFFSSPGDLRCGDGAPLTAAHGGRARTPGRLAAPDAESGDLRLRLPSVNQCISPIYSENQWISPIFGKSVIFEKVQLGM